MSVVPNCVDFRWPDSAVIVHTLGRPELCVHVVVEAGFASTAGFAVENILP